MPATTSSTQPDVYKCSWRSCFCTNATIRYTLFVLGKDQTRVAGFPLYGEVAQHIIGLSALQILKNNTCYEPAVPNVHVAASLLRKTPAEFSCLISMECKLIVRVSYFRRWSSFQVIEVESFCPTQPTLSVADIVIPT